MIRLSGVRKSFGALKAVDGITLEIPKGEIFGLVGPDGAGKTTTLRMLAGLIDPDEGSVRVAGLEVKDHVEKVKDQIGYMAQRFGLYGDLSVEENMIFYSDLFGLPHGDRDRMMTEFLEMTRMSPFRQRAGAKLSGGMKQKLALMCTLLHKPRVLFLDEPTNGVDPLSRRDFWVILKRLAGEGMTILVSTAYLDEAERCDRVGLMHRGRLIEIDPPSKMREAWAPYSFAVEGANRRAAREALHTQPFILGAEPAGAELHVYVDPSIGTARDIERELHAAGFAGASLRPIDPALEDVFIALIRREERRAAA
ncbi:MAG: ABC transporter ATP-binding protein [Bryobacteraceae bacterium]|jgi:ABC-2 type transport system ATP-binding protein